MIRRTRILLAADAIGGVWQYSLELARGLADIGVEVVLAVLGPGPQAGALREIGGVRLIETGLPLDWLAESPAMLRLAAAELATLARNERADIVQLNGGALAAEGDFDVPLVVVQHSCVASWWQAVRGGQLPYDFRWRSELLREGLARADRVVTPTAAFGEVTRALHGLRDAPITVHNGRTPLPLLQSARHDCVFTAGRLWDEAKGLRTLDQAAARLAVPVHAAGPVRGPNGERVPLDHIHCLGPLDERGMGRWLGIRPVFASAALYEPFGLAVLEAAAAGCPLVLSDIPTFRELWDGAACFVPVGDALAFAAVLEELIQDSVRREELGRAARTRAHDYRPHAMAAGMTEIYTQLLTKECQTLEQPVMPAAGTA